MRNIVSLHAFPYGRVKTACVWITSQSNVDFFQTLSFDDLLDLLSRIQPLGGASMKMYGFWMKNRLCCVGMKGQNLIRGRVSHGLNETTHRDLMGAEAWCFQLSKLLSNTGSFPGCPDLSLSCSWVLLICSLSRFSEPSSCWFTWFTSVTRRPRLFISGSSVSNLQPGTQRERQD